MYSRSAFQRQRELLKQVSRREGGLLAGVSVGLGVAQLVFLRWAEERLDDATATAIAGVAFLAYLALVAGLLWRYQRKLNAVRPRCPNCGSRLEGLSARVAAATGRCDSCGGQVLE